MLSCEDAPILQLIGVLHLGLSRVHVMCILVTGSVLCVQQEIDRA